jgi:type II secretory pathway pseudopilin PulG
MTLRRNSFFRRRAKAFTLVEVLVGTGLATILGGTLLALTLYTSRSFAALTNYVELDAYSKNALDRMTSEIRQTKRLLLGTTTRLVFEDWDGKQLIYNYDSTKKILTRTKAGVLDADPLLKQVDTLKFMLFQRNPKKGSYDQFPAATASTCKLVQMQWRCSRDLLYAKWNTESILSAKIVIRNNPAIKAPPVGPTI